MAPLNPKQDKALVALLTEPTISAAAKKAGIGERTLHTWLGEEEFATAYRTARRQAVGQAIGRLQQVSSKAVDALLEVIDTEYTPAPPAVRVSAACKILDLALKATELEDLAERIAILEQQMGAKP
jgi:hypothetical protein